MKTRFDETKVWVTGMGEVIKIANMETTHLMNTIKMFAQKPYISMGIIVKDIERNSVYRGVGEAPMHNSKTDDDVKKQSISNITSMSEQEIVTYTFNSPLGQAMLLELQSRGVNIQNFTNIVLYRCGSF